MPETVHRRHISDSGMFQQYIAVDAVYGKRTETQAGETCEARSTLTFCSKIEAADLKVKTPLFRFESAMALQPLRP